MTRNIPFGPQHSSAVALDKKMHAGLADSLSYMYEQIDGRLKVDMNGLRRQIDKLRDGDRFGPMMFCHYYDAAFAIFGADLSKAERIFGQLVSEPSADGGQQFLGLCASKHAHHRRYHELLIEDCDETLGIAEPSNEQYDSFHSLYRQGIELANRHLPDLLEEFRALVREVVCIAPDPDKSSQVDGGSHYRLWGALFLNTAFHTSDVAVVEVIAHESAHSLLFGHCTEEPLVLNPDHDRFPSPLRKDLRPMDGIYHATYVSARMHWAMQKLSESAGLDDTRKAMARAAAQTDCENFWRGYSVVREHADLTETGRTLLAQAHDYMDQFRCTPIVVDSATRLATLA